MTGEASEPRSEAAPKLARSRPIAPPPSPCRRPTTTITRKIPGRVKLPNAKRKAQARRNGRLHRKRKPSLTWARRPAGSGSRACWNGRPHRPQRGDRRRVGHRVDEERHRPAELEQHAAERRPAEPDHGVARLLRPDGRGQLCGAHDGAQRPGLGGEEDGGAGALDERHHRDLPEGHPAGEDRRGQSREGHGPGRVGGDHQPAAVVAVGRQAGREARGRPRDEPGEGDHARLRRRAGQRRARAAGRRSSSPGCRPSRAAGPACRSRKSRLRRRGGAPTAGDPTSRAGFHPSASNPAACSRRHRGSRSTSRPARSCG